MQHDALPTTHLDATATEQATLTALDDIVCTNTACLEATSAHYDCECSCDGAQHGSHQSRAGLIPARTPQPTQAQRTARATAAVFAVTADDDEAW